MGRLEIQIRHGHGGPEWPVIALLAFIVLAAAGGVGGHAARSIVAFVEVVAWVVGGLVIVGAAGLITLAVVRARTAHARYRDARPPVVTLAPRRDYGTVPDGGRAALDASRRTAPGWPLDDDRDEIPAPRADRRRNP